MIVGIYLSANFHVGHCCYRNRETETMVKVSYHFGVDGVAIVNGLEIAAESGVD